MSAVCVFAQVRKLAIRLAVLALVLTAAAGCASTPIPAGVVKEAVWTPCPVDVPARPVFPADNLAGNEDIFTLGTHLWADRKARQAYELELETRLAGCTRKDAP